MSEVIVGGVDYDLLMPQTYRGVYFYYNGFRYLQNSGHLFNDLHAARDSLARMLAFDGKRSALVRMPSVELFIRDCMVYGADGEHEPS